MLTILDKKNLRHNAIKKRNSMATNGIIKEKSSLIVSKILNSKEFIEAKHVALYYPIKNEVDLTGLLSIKGKDFYLPRCKGLDLEFAKFENNLIDGMFNIKEPKGHAVDPSIFDIIYIPALMANKKNYRLGYGKGYYDRFFSKNHLIKAKKIIVVTSDFYSESFVEDKDDYKCDFVLFE